MVMQWGQWIDHDFDHALPAVSSESWGGIDCKKSCDNAAPCFPMEVPPGDYRIKNRRCIDFFRTSAVCGSLSFFFISFSHSKPYIIESLIFRFRDDEHSVG